MEKAEPVPSRATELAREGQAESGCMPLGNGEVNLLAHHRFIVKCDKSVYGLKNLIPIDLFLLT
jgi:hypothetical protein